MKITLIEGPHTKRVRENASQFLIKLVKRDMERLGETHMKKVVQK